MECGSCGLVKSNMDHYDEDLYSNQFFIGFQKSEVLFNQATSQRFMVCKNVMCKPVMGKSKS